MMGGLSPHRKKAQSRRSASKAHHRRRVLCDRLGTALVEVITLDYRAIAERVRALVEAFRRWFRLACYFDAVIDASKERTWLDRREDSAALVRAMNGAFDKKVGQPPRSLAERMAPHSHGEARFAACVPRCWVRGQHVLGGSRQSHSARRARARRGGPHDRLGHARVWRRALYSFQFCPAQSGRRSSLHVRRTHTTKLGFLAIRFSSSRCTARCSPRGPHACSRRHTGHQTRTVSRARADTQAMREYYKPSAPTADPRLGRMSREAAMSWVGRFACGPLVESLSAPIFASLRPIRLSMYKAVGCKRVSECMCDPRSPRKTWESGSVASIEHVAAATQQAAAAEVKLTAASLVDQVLDLKAVHPLLTPRTRSALKRQLVERGQHTVPPADELSFRLEDLHARTAFLEAAALLCACRRDNTGDPPYVWEYFDGPLYHYLCGCPDEIKES